MDISSLVTVVSTGLIFPILTATCVGIFRIAGEFREFRGMMLAFRDNVLRDIAENKVAHDAIIDELRSHMRAEEVDLKDIRARIRGI